MSLSDNMRGALLMVASMACFSIGDACIKALGGHIPLPQILVLRGIVATAFIAAIAIALGQMRWRLARSDWGLIALRSLAETGAAFFFLTALFNMPLANVTALLQMLPLTVTLGSALFYAEPVGWRRWSAIAIGFIGMLLIVRPGSDGFTIFSIYALIAVVCVTIRDLLTRRMSRDVPSLTVTVWASAAVLVFASIWSLGTEWAAIDTRNGWLLLGASLCIIFAYTFSVMVMRTGEVSFVAPFRYTGLLWALVLGWFVFGDWPVPMTLIGAGLIVSTGVFTLLRETRKRPASQPKTVRT